MEIGRVIKGYATEQETFWAGRFGDEYIERNCDAGLLATNIALFSSVLKACGSITSAVEFGANIGLNIRALRMLLPSAQLAAIEINSRAAAILRTLNDVAVYEASILNFDVVRQWDLVLSKGVLIHIHPDHLPAVYERMYRAAGRYICVCEYYNPVPVEVPYRGHAGKLFKRDFAGELLDRYRDLRLVDYRFVYRRDPQFPADDLTWFLLEKNNDA